MFIFKLLHSDVVFCTYLAICVQCWCTDFFMPFQWYLFLSDAYVLLKPLWPCLSCAKMSRQSFRMFGTTMGVYRSLLSMIFHLRMLFSMVYAFLSRLLLSHSCFLSCFACGSTLLELH